MNDIKRIIQRVEDKLNNPGYGISLSYEVTELINLCEPLIEKATPKSPTLDEISELYKCPNCGKSSILFCDNNCSECGQALDWEPIAPKTLSKVLED